MTSMRSRNPVSLRQPKRQQVGTQSPRRFTVLCERPDLPLPRGSESGETIISGMEELHLEIYVERMRAEFGAEVETGMPQVAYREAISRKADFDYTHKNRQEGPGSTAA